MLAIFAAALLIPAGPSQLHVSGTKLLNAEDRPVHVRGINICSLEWTAAGEHLLESVSRALGTWKANFIRLPLNQDRWFGRGPDSKDDGASYRQLVDTAVKQIQGRKAYVMLDLHWSDGGVWGQNIGQHTLPDANSLEFWKSCAKRYANEPGVLFDLYNEPINAPWNVWRNGGNVQENFQGKTLSYDAVGLQTLLTEIRKVGAKNLVVAGGLGYASRLDFPSDLALEDPGGTGVLYADHFYPGWENTTSWVKRMETATAKLPVLYAEFGGDYESLPMDNPARRVAQVLAVFKKHDWNWVAWCMHPSAHPCVIADWNYNPTPYFGSLVMRAIRGQSVDIAPRAAKASDFVVYDGKLHEPWQSWGSAKLDFNSTAPVHSGDKAIAVTMNEGQTVQLGVVPFDGFGYRAIRFWLNGGDTGGQRLTLRAFLMDKPQNKVPLPALEPGKWTEVTVPFSELGIEDKEDVKSFMLTSASSGNVPQFSIADVSVLGKSTKT